MQYSFGDDASAPALDKPLCACDCHAPEDDATAFWRDTWGVPREPCSVCADGSQTTGED